MPTASINATDIYYETHGSGFPMVFVHGGFGGLGTGASAGVPGWVERMARHFSVILYDRRSSGRSGFPTGQHSMAQFADDLRALLGHLGHARAHVWGMSAGGHVAMEHALAHPEQVASLILSESAPWLSRDSELLAKLRERIEILERQGVEAAYTARRERGTVGVDIFARSRPAPDRGERRSRGMLRDRIRTQLAAVPREERMAKYAGELRNYSAYLDWDVSARFAELAMPLLIVHGMADSVFPSGVWEPLITGCPNVRYRAVEGAEHGSATQPAEVVSEILDFLLEHTPAAHA